MTKLLVSICPVNGARKPGVILEKTDYLREKIIEVMRPVGMPKEAIKKDQEDKIIIPAEDWELVRKFLNLEKVDISLEKSAYFFGKGEPIIAPYTENRRNIGFAQPREKEFGIYELAFSFSIYRDLGSSDTVWYKIKDAFVIYHFPKSQSMSYKLYNEIGVERCYFNMSKVSQFNRGVDWPFLPLCLFRELKKSNTDNALKLSLERSIEEGWKEFFKIVSCYSQKDKEYIKIYERLGTAPA